MRRWGAAALAALCSVLLVAPAEGRTGRTGRAATARMAAVGCRSSRVGLLGCAVDVLVGPDGRAAASSTPQGLSPAQIQDAYKLTAASATRGAGQVVGVVVADDDPNAEADLAVYRSTFGLPSCTSATGCFRKLNQRGGSTTFPTTNTEWAIEISTDLDMVSAVCPRCRIVLVEADDGITSNLAEAVATAVHAGATVVGNSYGAKEYAGETTFDRLFDHPGVPMVFAGGDSTYGTPWWPATNPHVIAVGGTTLSPAQNPRGWTEVVSGGTSSGCSLYEPKPPWQHDTGCRTRMANDVAAMFDTQAAATAPTTTGAAVYDTFADPTDPTTYDAVVLGQLSPLSGWTEAGGTSAAAQIVAAVYALAGNGRSLHYGQSLYQRASQLFNVSVGSNGDGVLPNAGFWPIQNVTVRDCGTYLCRGGPGYNGPTGNGTPDGLGAF